MGGGDGHSNLSRDGKRMIRERPGGFATNARDR